MSGTGRPIDPDSVSEEDLPDNWVEEKSEALKDVLSEMTAVYNEDNEPVDLKFSDISHADSEGEYIAINPHLWDEFDPPVTGPNILRVLDEINSHEMGHYNWSELDSKEEFSDMYPGWGEIPGHVANILEDEYVDARKMREFYGLRRKRAYRVKLTVDTEQFTPDVNDVLRRGSKANALVTALHQVALCGAVRGYEDAPDDIQEFCALVEPVVERVRRQNDSHERFKLFHVAMQILKRFVDDPDEFDETEFEAGTGKVVSGEPEEAPDEHEVDPEDAMPPGFEEMIEDKLEEMIEDGEMPISIDMDADEPMGGEDSDAGDGSGDDIDSSGESGEAGGVAIEVDLESDDGLDGDDGSSSLKGGSDELESEEGGGDDSDEDGSDSDRPDDEDTPDETGDDDGAVDGDEDGDAGDGPGGDEDETDGGDEADGESSPEDGIDKDVDKPDEMDMDAPERKRDIDGGEALHHIDDEKMEEFAEREMDGTIEDRYDVKLDEVDKVDERDRAKWARLVRQLQDYDLDIEVRKRERDDRIESRRKKFEGSYREERLSEGLRNRAERAGVIRELEEGFRELVSRGVPKPARTGTRIDPINVARRAAGDHTMTELFEEEQIVETGDRCVGLATDISGSMGSAIDELKIAGGAIAKATDIIGDEFVWEAFTDVPAHHGNPEKALDLRIVTGPNEKFSWEHVDSFGSARNEPTAAGIRDCFKLMQQADANQYVMIVITDGVALITEDGRRPHSNEPVEQARQAVNEVRSQGVDVIGLGIGSMDDRKMEETFGGKNYRLTNIDKLADDILDLYKEQLDTTKLRR